jgi:general secretion pathway protein K
MSCHRSERPPFAGRQRGAALVLALLVFGICAALMVAMRADFELFYQRGANSFLAEQSYAYLRGAEELAAIALVADFEADSAREPPRDDLGEIWAQPPRPYPLDDGGVLQGQLEDLQGRFNLNNLAGSAEQGEGEAGSGGLMPRFTPYQMQFIRLLQSFEEPRLSQQEAMVVTESIRDWLDSDTQPRPYGAEDDYYFGQTPAYRAANRPFTSVTELRAIANVTPALYRALAPWVTVWPREGGTLNIHTAPAQVLRSLNADDEFAPLDPGEAQALVSLRQEAPFVDLSDFLSQPAFAGGEVTDLRSVLGERSSWFLLSARVEVADRSARLYSVLHRNQRDVQAVARSSGEL